jgi:hypothetical protein
MFAGLCRGPLDNIKANLQEAGAALKQGWHEVLLLLRYGVSPQCPCCTVLRCIAPCQGNTL